MDLIKTFIDEIDSKPPMLNYPTNKKLYNQMDVTWSIGLANFSDYKTSNKKGFIYIFVIFDSFLNILVVYLLEKK